jgi:Macrocin-O-methyltransferase (TylF)
MEDLYAAYLRLLKRALIDALGHRLYKVPAMAPEKIRPAEWEHRLEGRDFPFNAATMIGLKRLDHLQECVEDVVSSDIPGDLIEAGVWRGGAGILMSAVLRLRGADRTVWLADSFEGFPDTHGQIPILPVPLEEVQANFEKYGMDGRVEFLKGWFEDTLPTVRERQWSLVRLDADLYESTLTALENLYPGLSPGGYLIVDDYGPVKQCRRAVHEFRDRHGITDPIERIDWSGVFWRKS